MDQENPGLFEEFDEEDRMPAAARLNGEITIRPAQVRDLEDLGRLSAEREGGEADAHLEAFRQALEHASIGHSMIVQVAEMDGAIIGFGRARYLDGRRGAGVGASPEGWYLTGLVVAPRFRRRGVGSELTAERLRWIAERSSLAYYISNARNRVSIALHQSFGFTEIARAAEFAGASFVGGEGILFQVDLSQAPRREL